MYDTLAPRRIEEILEHTMDILSESKSQMFDIVESAREEYNRISVAIEELKHEINQTVNQVDKLERDFKRLRVHLVEVNRSFTLYDEQERKKVYEEADNIRMSLAAMRERENNQQKRRLEQEQALVRLENMLKKAERMVGQVGVAIDFLKGNTNEINEQVEGMQARYHLGQKIIKVQEDERKRVAREIHDGPAQNLANVVLKAEIVERLYETGRVDEMLTEIAELKSAVKGSLQEVRKIIHNLRPMVLDDLGLIPAVKRLADEYSAASELEVIISVIGKETRIDSTIEVAVFRVIQEALNNSRKHAQANHVVVKIEFLQGFINAVISDDGVGFETSMVNEKISKGEHFGLYGMRERIELLGGTFNLSSQTKKGTRIAMRIPLKNDADAGWET